MPAGPRQVDPVKAEHDVIGSDRFAVAPQGVVEVEDVLVTGLVNFPGLGQVADHLGGVCGVVLDQLVKAWAAGDQGRVQAAAVVGVPEAGVAAGQQREVAPVCFCSPMSTHAGLFAATESTGTAVAMTVISFTTSLITSFSTMTSTGTSLMTSFITGTSLTTSLMTSFSTMAGSAEEPHATAKKRTTIRGANINILGSFIHMTRHVLTSSDVLFCGLVPVKSISAKYLIELKLSYPII